MGSNPSSLDAPGKAHIPLWTSVPASAKWNNSSTYSTAWLGGVTQVLTQDHTENPQGALRKRFLNKRWGWARALYPRHLQTHPV